jgi:hypothetical protein
MMADMMDLTRGLALASWRMSHRPSAVSGMATMSTVKISPPYGRSCCAPMYAEITLIRNAMTATTGTAW